MHQGRLTNISIPCVYAQIEMRIVARVHRCPCCDVEIVNIVTNIEIPLHYFGELDATVRIRYWIPDDSPGI